MNASVLVLADERLFLLVVDEFTFVHELALAIDDLIHCDRHAVGLVWRELDRIDDMLVLAGRKLFLVRAERFTGPLTDEF